MQDSPISVENAEHYAWGDGCDAWYLVRTPELTVIEELIPPGAAERAHYHRRALQFFYVLSGELEMYVEGVKQTLAAGHGLEIAPGKTHQAMNHGVSAARFLVTSQPPSHDDRVDV